MNGLARVVFLTGAGMSAESGDSSRWGPSRLEDFATQASFDHDPESVWLSCEQRLSALSAWEPHDGHRQLARLQDSLPNVQIVTQNTDGLHQRAGSRQVLELYGNLWRRRCDACGAKEELTSGLGGEPPPPRRHACGRYWRPDVVWRGDVLPPRALEAALEAIRGCDLLVSVGNGATLQPVAELPTQARERGARLIEINPEETPLSEIFDERMRGPASAMLVALLQRLQAPET